MNHIPENFNELLREGLRKAENSDAMTLDECIEVLKVKRECADYEVQR